MNIVVAGGTGLVGKRLVGRLVHRGDRVTILTRSASTESGTVTHVRWNGKDQGPWTSSIEEADAVVNLSGASVAGWPWTKNRRRAIIASRVDATRAIVEALRKSSRRERVLVNASGVGYYGNVDDGRVTESHPPGNDFLANVCRQWEDEAMKASENGVRVAMLRTGMVLDLRGGALARLVLPFRFFIGGPLGTGRQWVPWIHHDDMVGAILHLIATPGVSGPVNIVSPEAATMREFCEALGRALHRPSWIRIPAPMLTLALGEMASIILTGQHAVPDKLTTSGYRFVYPDLREALTDVVGQTEG